MKIIYLSSLCSLAEYERVFNKYGTVSSHASQRFHRLLTRGLIENGVEVETITHRSFRGTSFNDLKEVREQADGMVFNYLAQSRYVKLNRLYSIAKAYTKLRNIKGNHDEMLICVDILRGELSLAAVLFHWLHKCKIIAIVTDVPSCRAGEFRKGLRALPYKFKNFLISKYDAYVFLTEKMNETLNSQRKPYAIIEGIADDKIFSEQNEFFGKYQEKVVMMAGLLEKEYGVDELVQAFHNIKNTDARLHLYGKGNSVALIKEYAQKDDRICFFGEALNQTIIQEERKATLLVNPRQAIGEWVQYSFPSKNIEYISSGTPLLAYALPCVPSEYHGNYFTVGENGLECALSEYLSMDQKELYLFGIKAQKWIIENKKPSKQAEALIQLVSRL